MRIITKLLVSAVIFLSAHDGVQAGGDDWKSKISELQKTERLVKAAIVVRDRQELTRQSAVQHELFMWAAKRADKASMQSCGAAIGALGSFLRTMSGEDKAETYLDRHDYLVDFRVRMAACEAHLGLAPTPAPNLREGVV